MEGCAASEQEVDTLPQGTLTSACSGSARSLADEMGIHPGRVTWIPGQRIDGEASEALPRDGGAEP